MNNKIAIVGGGFTGLTAAYRLSKAGYKVDIFEKGPEVGGLAAGFEIAGTNIEKTYHHIFRSDTDIIELTNELGLQDSLQWHSSSVSIYYQNKLFKFGTPVSLLLFKPLNIIDRIRTGMVMFFLMKTKNWEKFVHVSASSWMRKWAGKNSYRVIWEPLLKGKFDTFSNEVSMAWLWARISIRANSQEKGGEKLGYFDGGFNVIVKKLVEKIHAAGGAIHLNADVKKIYLQDSHNLASSSLTIKTEEGEQQFDKVIATVPSHIFSHFLEAENPTPTMQNYITKLNSVKYLGAVIAVFSSEQSLGEYYWNNINDLTMPFLAFIEHTKLIDKSKYLDKNIYYIGTYVPHDHTYFTMSEEEIYSLWFDSVKKIFPHFDKTKVIEKHLFKLKYAQHIVDLDYESKIPSYETPVKNLYLSNFSQIFPEDRGTNFAVREGNKIAELITQE